MKFTIFDPVNRSQRADAADDVGVNNPKVMTIGDVIASRYSRRDIMKGALGFTAIAATVSPMALAAGRAEAQGTPSFDFEEIEAGVSEDIVVANGYDADVLIRWGDPVLPGAPEFDVDNQTAAAQNQQFGYNSDFIGTVPHPDAPDDPNRLILVNHHEYTNEELMFPGIGIQDEPAIDAEGKELTPAFAGMTEELVNIEKAAHGGSIIEIRRGNDGKWSVVRDSRFNRRITAETPMRVSGPAAGHAKMQTSADPSGTEVLGTFNNCAGGITPWGTWLMAEENFNGYFWSDTEENPAAEGLEDDPATILNARYGIPGKWYAWGKFDDRFNIDVEPNEPNRHGWIVEVNPADPSSTPVKRTAMGRVKHEGAMPAVNGDGRIAMFMGDDERFDYVYRFVTDDAYDEANPDPDILDKGTLSVAQFHDDGTMTWIPLKHGEGPLTAENGFADQGDVMVQTRRAADFVEATPMDRPEDVEPNPTTGKIYVMLTNNTRRKPGDENMANPRPENAFGHIIEITAPDGDFTAETMPWEILVKCGDPSIAEVGATFSPATSENGWFGMPDNCAMDADGRLWIATDGNSAEQTGRADGIWAMETEGEMRGTSKHFFRVPVGAEMCGPWFTDANDTLFLAVQHPGDGSTFEEPSTRWPDFADGMPPRPAVLFVTKQGGGRIG